MLQLPRWLSGVKASLSNVDARLRENASLQMEEEVESWAPTGGDEEAAVWRRRGNQLYKKRDLKRCGQ